MKRILLSGLLTVFLLSLMACQDGSKVVKMEILQKPTKLVYYLGQDSELNYEGGTILLSYKSNNTAETTMMNLLEDANYDIKQTVDFNTLGTYEIEFTSLDGLSASYTVEVQLPPYVDDNPIVIGLYEESSRVILSEYSGKFQNEVDVGSFSAVTTHETKLAKGHFQTLWKSYWDNYTGIESYKVGYELSFSLLSGEKIDKMILSPKDTTDLFSMIEVYIYDDVNQPIGQWYSHLLESQVTSKTLITSIKLHGCAGTKDIVSPITLTVFTYNGDEDFDPITHKYRGNSSYSIVINKSN